MQNKAQPDGEKWKEEEGSESDVLSKSMTHIPPHSRLHRSLLTPSLGKHKRPDVGCKEEEAGTHLGTEAAGGIGRGVHCSSGFHGALNGPCCVKAAPVIQGQAVLGRWRRRWGERRERWGHETFLTASTILRALVSNGGMEKGRQRGKTRESKVSRCLAKIHGIFYGEHHPTTQRPLSQELQPKSHTGVDIIFLFRYVCVCANVCVYLQPPH